MEQFADRIDFTFLEVVTGDSGDAFHFFQDGLVRANVLFLFRKDAIRPAGDAGVEQQQIVV